ncbi:MAG: cob(I)yrinic acid a,c-diamide adenosyltransferase [Reichenbachiella sp.]
MKIYTKTGDKGKTGILGGTRLLKSDLRIESYGTVDELNSYLGLLRDQTVNREHSKKIVKIQSDLFVIGSHLASDSDKSKVKIPEFNNKVVEDLEKWIDDMDAQLTPLKFFVLPGGHESVSFGHVARCVCRRAERGVVLLAQSDYVDENIVIYLNRLSDYLFVLCRWMSQKLEVEEIPWKP